MYTSVRECVCTRVRVYASVYVQDLLDLFSHIFISKLAYNQTCIQEKKYKLRRYRQSNVESKYEYV